MIWVRHSYEEETWAIQNMAIKINSGGARGVMVIVAEYGQSDTSSNPGPDWLHFT